MTRMQPPAYWLTAEQAHKLRELIREGRAREVGDILRTGALEVPSDDELPSPVLYGELLGFLAVIGNVPTGEYVRPEVPQTSDERIWMYRQSGICTFFDKAQATASARAIREFMMTATDEVLSDSECRYLILYSDQPAEVRNGVDFLYKVFTIPEPYDIALLVSR